ncbi:hypothetical protein [Paucisalibacillus sp. EB02]|uniref:hypothetical protein n=1 Tax=Paucisalibacillus sp. EB02 TaxID=1347087 RepID=UPI00069342EA|nr:hypothetical protein [Paucisalibacillus sp. EB02]
MVFFIIFLLLLVGCSSIQHNIDLEKSLYSIIEDKNKNEINLTSWTSFDWEKAFLFTPYTPPEEIEKQLGVDYNDPSDIDWRDDIYLLIFMNDEKVVQYVEVERQGADFTIGKKKYLTPSDDLIRIER